MCRDRGAKSGGSDGATILHCSLVFRRPRSSANAQTAEAMKLDVCPDSYADFPEGGPSLTCGCSAEAVKGGSVYGANPYMWQSNVCRAALHAGALGPNGGQVSVTFAKAPLFPAVTRNGVSSGSYRADKGFLVVVSAAAAKAVAAPPPPPAPAVDANDKPVQAPIPETLKTVGKVQVYINFAT